MAKFIYSTLSADQNFTVWIKPDAKGQVPKPVKTIVIAGKANIMHKKNMITPKGVVTKVEDAELVALSEMPAFTRFVDRGFITVEAKQVEVEKVAADMKKKDASAPITEEDIKAAGKTVKTNQTK